MIFVKIMPGKPYMMALKKGQDINELKPPKGFDSIAFYNPNEKESGLFKHDYMLFNNT